MTARGLEAHTSVVICTYSERRWADLSAAMAGVLAQDAEPRELVVIVDHNPQLAQRATVAWPSARVVESRGQPGLSGARNTGMRVATGTLVAYLDDDAAPEPRWLRQLVAPFEDPRVLATGGHAEASWDVARPRWFPREFDWVVGCSYVGQALGRTVVRNPLGCSMAFRRAPVLDVGGFTPGIGRLGRLPIGGEETELCIRLRRANPAGIVILAPGARVRHRVPQDRGTIRYFASRCYQEGRSKARIAGLVGSGDALASERAYVRRALPMGVVRGLWDTLRGDPAGLARAVAIVVGLACTTAGYLAGRVGLDALPAAPNERSAPS